ncbi:MAG: AAA family ATPase, partial [Aureliella sp.]
VPFDGIEFNEDFQWIDVVNEIAFPVMDFVARGRADLGWRLLNHYLEATGDYGGLSLLRFYLVYRALVRAKVTWLNPHNRNEETRAKVDFGSDDCDLLAGPWDKYLNVANEFALSIQPALTITHGFSGSGKSTVAMSAIAKTGGVRIRADAERMRLASEFPDIPKYSVSMSDRVYGRVLDVARAALEAGLPVIVDATFLQRNRRNEFERLAGELEVPYTILSCEAPIEKLRGRIASRGATDPSDATAEVLEKQIQTHDPLTTSELPFVVRSVS